MIKPLRGFVLIQPEEAENKTQGGIFLPERSQDKPAKGKIIAVGKPTTEMRKAGHEDVFEALGIKNGDIVYFKKWGGETIKEDGKEYVFVAFENLLGIIE